MKKFKLILKKIKLETSDTKTLIFERIDEKKLDFFAGQFLNLFFRGENIGKPYTISSSPQNQEIHITVKKQKNFSVRLHKLKIGEQLEASGPFGFLTLENIPVDLQENKSILIAGGIGITPFYSMFLDDEARPCLAEKWLFYASKNKRETIFYEELEKIAENNSALKTKYYWSDDKNKLSVEKIITELIRNDFQKEIKKLNFFICGSTAFVQDFYNSLQKIGILEKNIFLESFYS